jgi:hypothetical protein
MLIFGEPRVPDQTGMPHPRILYALVTPLAGDGDPVLHAVGCPVGDAMRPPRYEVVCSTTLDEMLDHATAQYGEEGEGCFVTCEACQGVPDAVAQA